MAWFNEDEARTMVQDTLTAQHPDPYQTFQFKIVWNGRYVAGASQVSVLHRSTEPTRRRGDASPSTTRQSIGQTDWEPITISRGVTRDSEFANWANKVWDHSNLAALGKEVSLTEFRKDIVIELYNEAGQRVLAYKCYRCWPSEFVGMAELNATGNAVAFQSITLQTESWERDETVSEPAEPTFGDLR
jgi:phage tail-like protein